MTTPWETEEESPEERKLDYQVKAHVVLEDSNTKTWGLVRDAEGQVSPKHGEGPVVGTWSKSPIDSCYHAFLETTIMALVDRATQRHAELAAKRAQGDLIPAGRPKSRARPREAPAPDVPSEVTTAIGDLRKNFQGG